MADNDITLESVKELLNRKVSLGRTLIVGIACSIVGGVIAAWWTNQPCPEQLPCPECPTCPAVEWERYDTLIDLIRDLEPDRPGTNDPNDHHR